MTYRKTLRELAFETHGVVILPDAEAAGVPGVEVRKLASRGALTRVGQGVYLMNEAPTDDLTEFAVAVALVGQDAVLADESVLAALDLAPVGARTIKVATNERIRKQLPTTVEVVRRRVPVEDRADVDGVPAMRLGTALLASRGTVMASRLAEAARVAVARGLLDHAEAEALIEALGEESVAA